MNGDDLRDLHTHRECGISYEAPIPDEALPDCDTCPKPELGPLNTQAVWLYSQIQNQQQTNAYSGHVYGLRFEALVCAIEWFVAAGRISDPDEVMERVRVIDEVACKFRNAKIDAENEASKSKASK